MEELINPALVILSDSAQEMGMNLLNNARNSLVENFWSIKRIFHEIEEIKFRLQGQERPEGVEENVRIGKLEARVSEVQKRVERMETTPHSSTNQSLNIIKGLNDNII